MGFDEGKGVLLRKRRGDFCSSGQLEIGEEDAVERGVEWMACGKCHGVRHWDGTHRNAWNQLVGCLSGGLLYGKEVRNPVWWKKERKRGYRPHGNAEVAKMLVMGKSYRQIAKEMGIGLVTVQGHEVWGAQKAGIEKGLARAGDRFG